MTVPEGGRAAAPRRRVAIAGASGRMGRTLIEAVVGSDDLSLAAAFDVAGSPGIGGDATAFLGRPSGVAIGADPRAALAASEVLIDFTRPQGTLAHLALCRELGVAAVVGTTGFDAAQKAEIAAHAEHIGIVLAPNRKLVAIDEPFTRLLTQGMVLNHIYSRRGETGGVEYFWPHDVENTFDAAGKITGAKLKSDSSVVTYEGVGTMSKSKHNGVDPQELIDRYGADTARLFVMFASPPEQTLEWNDAGVEGAHRFLRRLWKFAAKHADVIDSAPARKPLRGAAPALRHEIHSVLRQVSYDYERMQYNTVVSGAMKLLNALEAHAGGDAVAPAALREGTGILLRVLYPVCPHTTWALWTELGFAGEHGGLLDAPWPAVDEAALVQAEVELVLQINGKLRGSMRVPAGADRQAIEKAALSTPEFAKFAEGREVKRVVVIPGRLVNIVV